MRTLKALAFGTVSGLLLAGALQAQTPGSVKWMGVNGATGKYSNNNTGNYQWYVYTSPYKAAFEIPTNHPADWHLPPSGTTSFGPTEDIYCVDFTHSANTGTYAAFFTNLGTAGAGVLGTYTRSNSLQKYLAAAYLAEQIQLHPSNAGLLNGAIWYVMSGEPSYWWNGASWQSVVGTATTALTTGWKTVSASEWVVVTQGTKDRYGHVTLGASQEYITHVTAEPATLLLIGTGLLGMLMAAGAIRRPIA